MSQLELADLVVNYGRTEAVRGVSLVVPPGQVVALIGANGAGKTTIMRAISGLLRPRSGRVRFDGADITGWAAHVFEQGADNRLIRPLSWYEGPEQRPVPPMAAR